MTITPKTVFLLLVPILLTLALTVRAEIKPSSIKPVYGETNPTPEQQSQDAIRRYASVIELLPEKEESYRKLHADVWPEVLAAIKKANIQNYSIHLAELSGKKYLFSYFEYSGSDPEKDFA